MNKHIKFLTNFDFWIAVTLDSCIIAEYVLLSQIVADHMLLQAIVGGAAVVQLICTTVAYKNISKLNKGVE